jgi:hypothetical protein
VDVLSLYSDSVPAPQSVGQDRLGAAVAEEAAIDIITDLLYWFRLNGRDPDVMLDQAQARFEAESEPRLS